MDYFGKFQIIIIIFLQSDISPNMFFIHVFWIFKI